MYSSDYSVDLIAFCNFTGYSARHGLQHPNGTWKCCGGPVEQAHGQNGPTTVQQRRAKLFFVSMVPPRGSWPLPNQVMPNVAFCC